MRWQEIKAKLVNALIPEAFAIEKLFLVEKKKLSSYLHLLATQKPHKNKRQRYFYHSS